MILPAQAAVMERMGKPRASGDDPGIVQMMDVAAR